MERRGLGEDLENEIRAAVSAGNFSKLVQSERRGGAVSRVSLRPVEIGGAVFIQEETFREGRTKVRNLAPGGAEAAAALEALLAAKGPRDIHLLAASGDLHVRVTRKGKALHSRSAPQERPAAPVPHDRPKDSPLATFDSAPFLKACGIAAPDGTIRASMRGKHAQVEEFLRAVAGVLGAEAEGKGGAKREGAFSAVDCGCGKAYLTLALYLYLTQGLGMKDVTVTGIDRREDVVRSATQAAKDLGIADGVHFSVSELSAFDARRADLVVSLHACDTATDEALAKAVEWKAKYALCAPCCQHELQKTLPTPPEFAGALRHSLLRERLCDLLTDSFRAQIMRILGYRVRVAEFVSGEATARNLMLRCIWGVKPGQPGPVAEYLAMRDFWKTVPWLEMRLAGRLEPYLSRFS